MVVAVTKTLFQKKQPILIKYRNYKHFDQEIFHAELVKNLNETNDSPVTYDVFKDIFMNLLNLHAPIKEKAIRGNNGPFMNKKLSKSFMYRAQLKHKYNKHPTTENFNNYKKQRNYCVKLLKTEKKAYYNNLDTKVFTDNKQFWKSIKPLFSDKKK